MKNKSIFRHFVCITLLGLMTNVSSAQTFNPPTAYEDSYPFGGVNISRTTHTSCYSFSNLNLFGSSEDLVLSAWDEPSLAATVAWRRLVPGSPSSIISQGMIPYGNGYRDLEVGFIYVGGTVKIFVAYYKMGSGHYVDIYDLMPWGPVLSGNITLSNSTTYGRISLDCHKLYAMVVTWEDNAIVKTRVAWNNSGTLGVSPEVIFDPSSIKRYIPDVTFSHANSTGALLCEYVYLEKGSVQQLTQSSYDFWTMAGFGSTTIVAPFVQDVDVLSSSTIVSQPNIDCPDHYTVQNWAYTYHTNTSNDIYVRMIDYNSTGIPTTIVVNDGSLGITPTNWAYNANPFISYANNYDNFYVGWFTDVIDPMTGALASYISLNVHESGTFVMSAPDYLTVPNVPTDASGTPFLSFSKYTEASDYLYTIFPQYNTSTGYEMQHKYHNWGSLGAFKGAANHNIECNDKGKDHYFANTAKMNSSKASVYPNPFTSQISLYVSPNMQNEIVDVVVTDIRGVVVFNYSGNSSVINNKLKSLTDLQNGIYIMQVKCNATGYDETMKINKIN